MAPSFFWNNIKDGGKFKNASVAEFWFSRAAEHGSPEGRNNLAVLLLDRADDPSVLSKSMGRVDALRTPDDAHCIRAFRAHAEIGYGGFDRTLLGGLLEAVGRQLTFAQYLGDQADDEEDEVAEDERPDEHPWTGVRYSRLPIRGYFHIETARNIAGLSDSLPAWNLFWLSVDGAEPALKAPKRSIADGTHPELWSSHWHLTLTVSLASG